jgi:hypothetical protein
MISEVRHRVTADSKRPPKELFSGDQRWEPKVTIRTINHWCLKDRTTPNTNNFFGSGWTTFNTPLTDYAYGQLMEPKGDKYVETFIQYLLTLVNVESRPAVLDVGGGGFRQWTSFVENNPQVNFNGTALTMWLVVPQLQPFVKKATAGGIWRHFDKSSFDLIVTRWGAYNQNIRLIENAMRLLKIGADLILTSPVLYSNFRNLMAALSQYDGKILKVFSSEEENLVDTTNPCSIEKYARSYAYTLQIRKLAEP